MAPTPAGERPLAEVHHLPSPARPPPRIGLSAFDAAPLTALVRGDPAEVVALVEDVRQLADALAGPDSAGALQRLMARQLAVTRGRQRILEGLQAQTLAQRDEVGFRLVDRALYRVNQQLASAMKAMAVEAALSRRPTVIIGNAESVTFSKEQP